MVNRLRSVGFGAVYVAFLGDRGPGRPISRPEAIMVAASRHPCVRHVAFLPNLILRAAGTVGAILTTVNAKWAAPLGGLRDASSARNDAMDDTDPPNVVVDRSGMLWAARG